MIIEIINLRIRQILFYVNKFCMLLKIIRFNAKIQINK